MRQHTRTALDERKTDLRDPSRALDIFVCNRLRHRHRFFCRTSLSAHPVKGVFEVGGGRACYEQRAVSLPDIRAFKIRLGQAVRRGGANGPRAANDHRLNRAGCFPVILQPQQRKPVGQQWLVDHNHIASIHPHCPIIPAPDSHGERLYRRMSIYNFLRPSSARASVTSSADSSALPADNPNAMRLTTTPTGLSCPVR